jgi:hypothetical protein
MKKAPIGLHQPIMPDGQPPEAPQPANRTLHDLAVPEPAQLPSVLVGGPLVIGPSGNNRLNPPSDQHRVWVALLS